ncbi:replication/maintenance protein RepL [Clostridium thermobutyricum]|uniref:replication/maintenance protein RepL n=1 Tax=Clostridium thermobutyricum TaxID=29372 RepID=UPI0018A95932|nr:replication/maintenance protein RepL [Clostridium thermobutyricum]MDO4589183.1 replication/maintenance protein RepL [Fusobacterium sp.]
MKDVADKHKSKFKDFYQINKKHSDKLIALALKNPKANALLLFILNNMDGLNALQCSSVVLQEALGMSRTTIYRLIKYLQQNGFIAVLKSGTSNVYVVNDDLAWSSWSNNKQYCKFPATVMLSGTENSEFLQKLKVAKKTKINSLELKNK